jgi:arylsulfatase
MKANKLQHYGLSLLTAGAALFGVIAPAQAADKKPNILVIWGDDIGIQNISYNKTVVLDRFDYRTAIM